MPPATRWPGLLPPLNRVDQDPNSAEHRACTQISVKSFNQHYCYTGRQKTEPCSSPVARYPIEKRLRIYFPVYDLRCLGERGFIRGCGQRIGQAIVDPVNNPEPVTLGI